MKKYLIFVSTLVLLGVTVKVLLESNEISSKLIVLMGLGIYLLAVVTELKKLKNKSSQL